MSIIQNMATSILKRNILRSRLLAQNEMMCARAMRPMAYTTGVFVPADSVNVPCDDGSLALDGPVKDSMIVRQTVLPSENSNHAGQTRKPLEMSRLLILPVSKGYKNKTSLVSLLHSGWLYKGDTNKMMPQAH